MRKTGMAKIETFALAFALSLSLAACGGANTKNSAAVSTVAETTAAEGEESAGGSIGTGSTADLATLMTEEPADAHAAAELYQALMAQENEILAEDSALWEKVFLSIDKDQQKLDEGADHGDYLLKAIDGAKEPVFGSGQIGMAGMWGDGTPAHSCDDYIKENPNYRPYRLR